MSQPAPTSLNIDPRRPVFIDTSRLPWTPSPRPGVERRFLARQGGELATATSLVRYAPGASFRPHVHDRGEEFLVLHGVFSDENGDYPAGTYVRNPPGSRHAPSSAGGCVIFVKLRQMSLDERATVVIDTTAATPVRTAIAGLNRIELYDGADGEQVSIDEMAPGTSWSRRRDVGGEEILVLAGSLVHGGRTHGRGAWLRSPGGEEAPIRTLGGCRMWVKRGHLAGPAGGRPATVPGAGP